MKGANRARYGVSFLSARVGRQLIAVVVVVVVVRIGTGMNATAIAGAIAKRIVGYIGMVARIADLVIGIRVGVWI